MSEDEDISDEDKLRLDVYGPYALDHEFGVGRGAYILGKKLEDNPYPKWSRQFLAWDSGFFAEQEEHEEESDEEDT